MEKIPVSGRNGFIPSHHYAVPWDCLLAPFLEKERVLDECPGGTPLGMTSAQQVHAHRVAGGELVLPVLVTTANLKEIALQGY
jgi:hypothetical protein